MMLGCKTPDDVIKAIKDHGVEMVDLRFTDLPGMWQHTSFPAGAIDVEAVDEGLGFDGSSIRGFQEIHASDMLLMPDEKTAFLDPFCAHKTLVLICDVRDPVTKEYYSRDPRGVARKAEEHLNSSGIGTRAFFGPEAEFFVFDDVRYGQDVNYGTYFIDSVEGHWNMAEDEGPNLAHKIRPKEGYFPVPPSDTLMDIRAEMALTMERIGIKVECHHHEVATAGQCEIDMKFDTLVSMADKLIKYKYVVKNVARRHGKTATFMPKPLFGDNGSGMHVHQSVWDGDKPIFGDPAALRRAVPGRALLRRRPAQARPGAARVRRADHQLLPPPGAGLRGAGQSGLVDRATARPRCASRCTRTAPRPSASSSAAPTRRATRTSRSRPCSWPASTASRNRIDPGDPVDKNIYDLPPEELAEIPTVPGSLAAALAALEADHEFLTEGDVFTEDFIENYLTYKREKEVDPIRLRPHPYEFVLYYDI